MNFTNQQQPIKPPNYSQSHPQDFFNNSANDKLKSNFTTPQKIGLGLAGLVGAKWAILSSQHSDSSENSKYSGNFKPLSDDQNLTRIKGFENSYTDPSKLGVQSTNKEIDFGYGTNLKYLKNDTLNQALLKSGINLKYDGANTAQAKAEWLKKHISSDKNPVLADNLFNIKMNKMNNELLNILQNHGINVRSLSDLDPTVRHILQDAMYNMGADKLNKFNSTLKALKDGDLNKFSYQLHQSNYYDQVSHNHDRYDLLNKRLNYLQHQEYISSHEFDGLTHAAHVSNLSNIT